MLKTAIEAAQQAGRLVAERYPSERRFALKGFRDLVSDADTAAEAQIIELITRRFPGHAILSEEAGGPDAAAGEYTWVIDPLDGTTNYVHRHPVFAVSIGVLQRGRPLLGVVHDPLRNHTFAAHRGGGARLNNEPIQVSAFPQLGEALLGFDWGHSDEMRGRIAGCAGKLLTCCGGLRVMGSACLALAYVAAGWLDGYFQAGLKPWDTAAGILLVSEAGGCCSTLQGEPFQVGEPGCLASNGAIHDSCLEILQGVLA